MKYLVTLNRLKTIYYCWFNRLYFKYKGIQYGKNMQVYNKIYIAGMRGIITIGDDLVFTSGGGINPISRNIRGCLKTSLTSSIISIGNHVGISSACIWARKQVVIGNYVNIGANCIIMDTDVHELNHYVRRGEKSLCPDDPTTEVQSASVTIEDDVWLGANVMVLKGVTIGARSVIGAGSVVTKSIPNDCIAAGNPCKVIKKITTNE